MNFLMSNQLMTSCSCMHVFLFNNVYIILYLPLHTLIGNNDCHLYDEIQFPEPIYAQVQVKCEGMVPSITMDLNEAYSNNKVESNTGSDHENHQSNVESHSGTTTGGINLNMSTCQAYGKLY